MERYKKITGLHFTYNFEDKSIDLSDELCAAYAGMPKHFDNMPYSFAEMCVHEEDIQHFCEMYEDINNGIPFATSDFRIKSPSGWARVCLFHPNDRDKTAVGIVQNVSERYSSIMEETERKKAELNLRVAKELEALQLMRAVSDSSDMIISVNLTQNNYYVISNRQLQSNEVYSDGTFDELFLKNVEFIPDQYKEEFESLFSKENLMKAYEKGDKFVYLEHLRYDDSYAPYWVSTHFMFTENPYSDDVIAIIVRRNITERRKREAKQKQLLKDALIEAKKANSAKSDFLSRMSHDIRTPMNAIVGFTNFAMKEDDFSVVKSNYLPKIQTAGEHLLMLINDILEMSRIESGKVELKEAPHHLGEISKDIAQVVGSLAEEKRLNIKTESIVEDYYIYCDKLRITQIITNLLSNAFKFTPACGTVTVAVKQYSCDEQGYAVYEFNVSDTGIGMSAEFLKNIFDPFEREHSSTISKIEGTGLGLSIVKSIVDIMGGSITVDSQVNKGTNFKIRLKFRLAEPDVIEKLTASKPAEPEVKAEDVKSYFRGKRLLLVEDNELNRIIAETILSEAGFAVDMAEDGIYAVDMIKAADAEDYYDAVLMDVQMPIMGGYEATRVIRSLDGDRRNVKIIAVTANAFESDIDEAKKAGMDAHISKPINVDDLYKILLKEIGTAE